MSRMKRRQSGEFSPLPPESAPLPDEFNRGCADNTAAAGKKRKKWAYYAAAFALFVCILALGEVKPEAKPQLPEPPADAPRDFPFSVLARTMRRVLSDSGERILSRAPNRGCTELRQAIAAYLARSRGIIADPEQIIVGSGAEYLYGLVVQLLGRGCMFALEDPSYEKIRLVYEANGADCVMLKMGADGIRSDALFGCAAGALHVTPYHSFPSGVTASASKRHEYAAWAEERGAYIIEDDYDSEFSAAAKQVETIFSVAPERVIYINTFSKTFAPSMRMGYMLLPAPLMREYAERLDFYSCTVPVFEQLVLAEFIDNGDFERYINRRRREMRGRRG